MWSDVLALRRGEPIDVSEPERMERCHDCYFCGGPVPVSKAVAVDTPEGSRPWVTACPSCAAKHAAGELSDFPGEAFP